VLRDLGSNVLNMICKLKKNNYRIQFWIIIIPNNIYLKPEISLLT